MRGMVRLLRHDMRHLRSSVIAVVVFAGIVAVPSFYAWFNIAGSWDPYGRTGDVRVAVANEDAGYEGALVPVRVNLGERVVAELCSSTSIGYEVTSADEAVEGVRSGRYYAAVVVPEDFSKDLMTVFSADPVSAEVPFYQNEKENAIASIVTGKAASSVQSDIGRSFAEAVADVGTAALQELSGLLDDDAVVALAGRLDDAVTLATDELETTAGDVRGLSSLLSSTQALLGSGAGTVDAALSPALDVSGALGDAAGGLDEAGTALDGAQSSVRDALAQAGSGVDGVGTAIENAFDAAGAQVARVRDGLVSAHDAVAAQVTLLERLYGALDEQDGLTREFQGHLEAGSATAERVETVRVSVEGLRDRVGQALDDLRALEDGISDAIADLDTGTADAQEARERLAGLVEDARDAVAGAGTAFDDTAKESLDELAGLVEDAASQAGGMRDALSETLASVSSSANGAAQTLSSGAEGLTKMADDLDAAAGRLSDLHDKLRSALDSHDAKQVRAVLSAGPTELERFVAEPVSVERTAVFHVENNGSAMAPFYTTLAIWIGGVVLAALVRVTPSGSALEETGVEVSVALVDLETRRGLWYDADASRYPASSIKAAYCTWICESHGGSGGMANSMASCLLYSSNDDYHALLDAFGLSAYAAWLGEKGAPQAASTGDFYYYPYTTANELASIWQEIHRYGTSGEAGSEELVGYLSQTTSTPLAETLRESCEVWSKAGWYPADGTGLQSTNDAGVVFSDTGTYVVVIMTNMSSNLDGLKPLIAALDQAHDVMCGDEVAYYE